MTGLKGQILKNTRNPRDRETHTAAGVIPHFLPLCTRYIQQLSKAETLLFVVLETRTGGNGREVNPDYG